MLVVHDGVGMTYMGHPFAPYLSLGVFLCRSIDLGSPMVSPDGDPVVWVFPSPTWGGGESPACGDALVFCAQRAVVVVHTQAMSRLTRRCSVEQGASHQLGHVPSYPICIKWGRERVFRPRHFAFP